MNHPVALDAALETGTPDKKDEPRLLPMWSLIVVGVVLITAQSDRSLTPDQRLEVFQQSGMYP